MKRRDHRTIWRFHGDATQVAARKGACWTRLAVATVREASLAYSKHHPYPALACRSADLCPVDFPY